MIRSSVRATVNAAAVLCLVTACSGCSYNRFTTEEEDIKGKWGEVQNQLQRRNDLIPNLVETVKGYAQHEQSILQEIADSRSKLLAVVDNYPNLKANEQFNRLSDELAVTENRIAVARGRYNQAIQQYNTDRRKFPSNVTAKVFGFKEYPYFEAPPPAQAPPKVSFGK